MKQNPKTAMAANSFEWLLLKKFCSSVSESSVYLFTSLLHAYIMNLKDLVHKRAMKMSVGQFTDEYLLLHLPPVSLGPSQHWKPPRTDLIHLTLWGNTYNFYGWIVGWDVVWKMNCNPFNFSSLQKSVELLYRSDSCKFQPPLHYNTEG